MIILICESDTEAEEFTEWLNANGIGAELTMNEPDSVASQRESDLDFNKLWENYCNA